MGPREAHGSVIAHALTLATPTLRPVRTHGTHALLVPSPMLRRSSPCLLLHSPGHLPPTLRYLSRPLLLSFISAQFGLPWSPWSSSSPPLFLSLCPSPRSTAGTTTSASLPAIPPYAHAASRVAGSFHGPCSDHRRRACTWLGHCTLPWHESSLAVSMSWPSDATQPLSPDALPYCVAAACCGHRAATSCRGLATTGCCWLG